MITRGVRGRRDQNGLAFPESLMNDLGQHTRLAGPRGPVDEKNIFGLKRPCDRFFLIVIQRRIKTPEYFFGDRIPHTGFF